MTKLNKWTWKKKYTVFFQVFIVVICSKLDKGQASNNIFSFFFLITKQLIVLNKKNCFNVRNTWPFLVLKKKKKQFIPWHLLRRDIEIKKKKFLINLLDDTNHALLRKL